MIRPKYETVQQTPAESRAAYARAAERSAGLCEICGEKQATETHHRLHRAHGTLDTVENLIRVCGWGNHTGCHGRAHNDSKRYANGWAVRSGFDPALTSVLYRGRLMILTADGGLA
jgi:5-methylcytosine-specific restriction endonuclease McrA